MFDQTPLDRSNHPPEEALPREGASLSPCYFSPDYRIPATQAWRSLWLFVLYRIGLGMVLGIPLWIGKPSALWSIQDNLLFQIAGTTYLASAAIGIPLLVKRRPSFPWQVQVQVLADIVLVSILMKASGGVSSGLGILLACTVAAGGILAGGRCALGFAAVATLAVLSQEMLLVIGELPSAASSTSAGLLGAALFAIALLAMALSRRAEQSQLLAARSSHDLANLRYLNTFIVEHLQSGIIVLDDESRVRMANPAALRLLGISGLFDSVEQAGAKFRKAYRDWLTTGRETASFLTLPEGEPVLARFARLPQSDAALSMVMLEDHALHQRRVQQSKLKSLGQLTASIAHEIRNPLSAIHHAAQLLNEASGLGPEDQNLIRIILKHTRRVNEIIEDLTQVSRRRSPERDCIVLGPWLKRFLSDFVEEHRLVPTTLTLQGADQDLEALVDTSHLKQVMENLCSNAIKYGKPEIGGVEIRVGTDARDSRPCIEVIDHGGGMKPQIAEKIFEPFFTTSANGTGLGLYIARELAELNQARLEYQPGDNGSVFRVSLADGREGAVEL